MLGDFPAMFAYRRYDITWGVLLLVTRNGDATTTNAKTWADSKVERFAQLIFARHG